MFLRDGKLAQPIIRPRAGPRPMTLKAPDRINLSNWD